MQCHDCQAHVQTNFDDVRDFHLKFNLPVAANNRSPRLLTAEEAEYRLRFLQEELEEVAIALGRADLAGFFDGLLDLAWVAMGTAHYAGLPWEEGWAEVARANFDKVRASELPEGSHKAWRGAGDIVKPPGWEPPRLALVLEQARAQARAARESKPRIAINATNKLDEGSFGGYLDEYSPGANDSEGGAP